MMGLSLSERRKLRRIDAAVRCSDPRLASLIGMFSRLAAGDAMPGREQLRSRYGGIRRGVLAAVTVMTGMITVLAAMAARLGTHVRPCRVAAGLPSLRLPVRRARRPDQQCAVTARSRANPGLPHS